MICIDESPTRSAFKTEGYLKMLTVLNCQASIEPICPIFMTE